MNWKTKLIRKADVRDWMSENCRRQYCCPHMVLEIASEGTELFFEFRRNAAKSCSVTLDDDRLLQLALDRTAAKHRAVRRLAQQ